MAERLASQAVAPFWALLSWGEACLDLHAPPTNEVAASLAPTTLEDVQVEREETRR